MQLNVSEHVILDVCIFIVVLCFGFMYYIILKQTNNIFMEAGTKGDKFLLVVYLAGIVLFVALLGFIKHTIQRDEVNVNIRMNDLDAKSFVARVAEYNRAYNDIMDNFENYFSDEGSLTVNVEEQISAPVLENTVEPEVIEQPVEEVPAEVLEHEKEILRNQALNEGKKPEIVEETQGMVDKINKQYKRGLITEEERFTKVIETWNGATDRVKAELEEVGVSVYFAHPYSSWERGQNERHNRLFRRYIPKGKSIDNYSAEQILCFADEMNALPRKHLGYSTPEELFDKFLDQVYSVGKVQWA